MSDSLPNISIVHNDKQIEITLTYEHPWQAIKMLNQMHKDAQLGVFKIETKVLYNIVDDGTGEVVGNVIGRKTL